MASIVTRTKVAWKVFRHGLPTRRVKAQSSFLSPATGAVDPQWQTTDYSAWASEGYGENSLFYSAVMYKVRSKMSAPLRAYSGDPRTPEPLPPDHPLSRLVDRPNPHQSGIEFHALAEVYFSLGNFFGVLVRPETGGLPERMYCLRPDRVYIVPDSTGPDNPWERSIKGYLYVPPGKSVHHGIPILAEDMMHVKYPNPKDPLEGLGHGEPPVCIGRSVDVDNDVTRYMKAFFQSGALLQALLKFDIDLDDEDIDLIKERWQRMHGGHENWTEVGVLGSGGSYQRIGTSFDEMGFETIDERNESRILGPLGVPPILIGTRVGLNRSTYSNYAQARRAYWEDTAVPEQDLFEIEYRYYLQTDDGGFVMFDRSNVPALQTDIPGLTDAAYKLWQMGVPANSAFDTVGLQVAPIPGGNVSWLPMNLIPAGASIDEEQSTEGAAEAEDDTRKNGDLQLMVKHQATMYGNACILCGQGPVHQYNDHGGLCVCDACGCTFDPQVERATT